MSRVERSQKKKRTNKGGKRKWFRALAISPFLIGGIGYGAYAYLNINHTLATPNVTQQNSKYHAFAFNHRITILLMGSSLVTQNHHIVKSGTVRDRADTIMLVSINPKTKKVGVLSIPRDSRVFIPHVGKTKIAEATFFGGPKEMVQVIGNTFHIPIDYYAYVSMFNFEKIINDMGGLTVYVPQKEVYGSVGDPLRINLSKGYHHLNGQQVLEFARFRATQQGDISRIQQQQVILKDIAHKMLKPQNYTKIPVVAADVLHALSFTNLNLSQIISLGLFGKNLKLSSVRFATLPGSALQAMDPFMHQKLDYWRYSPHLANILIQDVLLAKPLTSQQKKSIRISINSGTQTLASAQKLATFYRNQGYTVTGVGWANTHNHKRTVVINDTGDKWLGQRIASPLGKVVDQFSAYHTTPWDIKITVGSDLPTNL